MLVLLILLIAFVAGYAIGVVTERGRHEEDGGWLSPQRRRWRPYEEEERKY